MFSLLTVFKKIWFLIVFLYLVGLSNSQSCENVVWERIEIPSDGTGINITNPKTVYPGNCVDAVWTLTEDVEIKVHKLNVDGQNGDFVLVSSNPVLRENATKDLENILPVSDFILLSWVDNTAVVNVISPSGSFIYFHGEKPLEGRELFQEGFLIEILPFVKVVPIVSTTTEKNRPTIDPNDDPHINRFLTGMNATEFVESLHKFKEIIAEMAIAYCEEKGIVVPGGIGADDVVVPYDKIRYCDESWPTYEECVEVKFGIAVLDKYENYLMIRVRLNEMWDKYSEDKLKEMDLENYTPPDSKISVVPWIWVASMLGVIVAFSAGLCFVWLKNDDSLDTRRNQNLSEGNVEEGVVNMTFFDKENPISGVAKEMNKRKEEIELVEQRRRFAAYR